MSYRSPLDSERFGVAIGRALLSVADELPALLHAWMAESLEMVIIRASAANPELAQAIEAAGGRLCDTLVYYTGDLTAVPSESGHEGVRPASSRDAEAVAAVAAAGFRDYPGHYHADPRLDDRLADAGYVDWARRCVAEPGVADRVWVADADGVILGFLGLRIKDQSATEILLNAVAPAHQGGGVYRALLSTAMAASRDMGANRIRVSTQVVNYRVQRIWVRAGLEPSDAFHTFHLWMDDVRAVK